MDHDNSHSSSLADTRVIFKIGIQWSREFVSYEKEYSSKNKVSLLFVVPLLSWNVSVAWLDALFCYISKFYIAFTKQERKYILVNIRGEKEISETIKEIQQ